jgi:hypothetical protein
MSMSQSTSNGSSTNTSSSNPVQTPENDIINSISGVASGLANQMLNWAQGVFAQTSAITSQAVGNFMTVSQNMLGLSNNLTGQYNNLFAPENAQLVADANSYASPARMQADMGMAGATSAQAGDAALKNSEASLQSFGINPADGRYAALDKAAAVQNAANVAGAENVQRQADITTGQNLRSQAVQVGAQLPAAIANVNNTAIQANTGAANATDANANTGRNLMSLPNDYLKTAMDVKMPFNGQTSNGVSRNNSVSNGAQPNQPTQGNGSGNGSGNNGGNAGNSPSNMNPALYTQPSTGGGGAGGPRQPNSAIMQVNGSQQTPDNTMWNDPMGQNYDPMSSIDPSTFDGGFGGTGNMSVGQSGAGFGDGTDFGVGATNDFNTPNGSGYGDQGTSAFGGGDFGQTLDPMSGLGGGQQDNTFGNMNEMPDTSMGNISYDPSANQSQGFSDPNAGSSDFSSSAPDDSENFASGGAIPGAPPAHAGPLPAKLSPSGGRQVDDIRAKGPGGMNLHMNANEFVIPQDVALWKGQEFFQKLIAQARTHNAMAAAHGQPAAPQQAMR